MNQSLADKFAPKHGGSTPPDVANRNEKSFLTLQIVKKTGEQWLVPYAYFVEASMPASKQTLTIRFTHRTFVVHGTNLQTLFDGLSAYGVEALQEADSAFERAASPDQVFVETITTE